MSFLNVAYNGLTPVANKISSYTAINGDFIPVDTTSNAVTITLPKANNGDRPIGVKMVTVGGTNTATVSASSTDVFNKSGGGTNLTLSIVNQTMILIPTNGIWIVQSTDVPLNALDGRYPQKSTNSADAGKVIDAYTGLPITSAATSASPIALGNTGASKQLTVTAGDSVQYGILTADTLVTLPPPVAGKRIVISLTQDSTGSRQASFVGQPVTYPNGDPAWLMQPGDINIFELISIDGSSWMILPVTGSSLGYAVTAAMPGDGADGIRRPQDFNLKAWNYSHEMISAGSLVVSGQITLQKVMLRRRITVTNVLIGLVSAGTNMTSGQNFIGIYAPDGTRVGVTADQSGSWASTPGMRTIPLVSSADLNYQFVYVALLSSWSGGTAPTFGSRDNFILGASALNLNLTASQSVSSTILSGQTNMPSALDLSSATQSTRTIWVSIS